MKNNNKPKTIVVFDCRGLEPVDFSPSDTKTVATVAETLVQPS